MSIFIPVIIKLSHLPNLLVLFLLASCTQLMNQNNLSYDNLPLLESSIVTSCQAEMSQAMLGSNNESGAKIFFDRISDWRVKYQLSEIDEFVLWSLYQFNLRPDSASPTARFQALIFIKGSWKYWDVSEASDFEISLKKSNDTTERPLTYPYLHALDQLLISYQSKNNLIQLARILNREIPNLIPISKGFAHFLESHATQLQKNPQFQKAFFKGEQPLKAEESIPRLNFEQLIRETSREFKIKKHYHTHHHLFTHQSTKAQCSFDANIYQHGVHLVSLQPLDNSNPHLMIGKRGSLFLGVSAQRMLPKRTVGSSYLLASVTHTPPSAFCLLPTESGKLTLLSSEGRDPAQLLQQLLESIELDSSLNSKKIEGLLQSSRAISLYNPDRIVYESQRPMMTPVKNMIERGVPLYHAARIGDIWGLESRNKDKKNILYSDRRGQGVILCPNS
jgi:hypothetical protein